MWRDVLFQNRNRFANTNTTHIFVIVAHREHATNNSLLSHAVDAQRTVVILLEGLLHGLVIVERQL